MTIRPPWRTLLTALIVVCAGSFHLGYHFTVINPSYRVFHRLINDTWLVHYDVQVTETELKWICVLPLGEGIGCLSLIVISSKMGRIRGIAISNAIVLLSLAFFIVAKDNLFELFAIGRFIAGIGLGMVMGFQAVFLQEIGSPEYASIINVMASLMMNTGATFAALVGGVDVLVPSLLLSFFYLLFFAHETPYYLMKSGQEKSAIDSIYFYHRQKSPAERTAYVEEIKNQLKLYSDQLGLMEVVKIRPARKALFLSISANIAVVSSGLFPILFFGTELIEKSGIESSIAQWITIFANGLTVLALCITAGIIEPLPRRLMLAGGCAAFAVINFIIVGLLAPSGDTPPLWVGITFSAVMAIFLLITGFSLGNITLFIAMELSAASYANIVSSIAISCQAFTGFVFPFIFYPLNDAIGAYSFLMCAVPMVAFATYFYFNLPETLNRPLAGILMDLGATDNDVAVLNRK